MAKRKDIFKKHTNLRSLSIVFLSLAVILGVVWYVNSYSDRSSAKGKTPNWACKRVNIGNRCQGSKLCKAYKYITGNFPNADQTKPPKCNIDEDKIFLEYCKHSDRCDPGDNPPPAAPSNYKPVGRVDGTDDTTCTIWGWACDKDDFSKSLKVRIVAAGKDVGETTAGNNAPDVAGQCGGYSNHRYHYSVPKDSFIRGAGSLEMDVLAVDINSSGQETGNTSSILGSRSESLGCSKYNPSPPPP